MQSIMDIAAKSMKRAVAAEFILKAKGYSIELSRQMDELYVIYFYIEFDESTYVASAFFCGNEFQLRIMLNQINSEDLSTREVNRMIAESKKQWFESAPIINRNLEGRCFLAVDEDDDPSLSFSGLVKGYCLEDACFKDSFSRKVDRFVEQMNKIINQLTASM